MKTNLKWFVYRHDISAGKIVIFNIFDHWKFAEDVKDSLKHCANKEQFEMALRNGLFYYFCMRNEYEVLITPTINSPRTKDLKVDIYNQVMNNWNVFLDYVWNCGRQDQEGS